MIDNNDDDDDDDDDDNDDDDDDDDDDDENDDDMMIMLIMIIIRSIRSRAFHWSVNVTHKSCCKSRNLEVLLLLILVYFVSYICVVLSHCIGWHINAKLDLTGYSENCVYRYCYC